MNPIQIDDETSLRVEASAGMVLIRVTEDDASGAMVLSIDEAAALIAHLEHAIGDAYTQRQERRSRRPGRAP